MTTIIFTLGTNGLIYLIRSKNATQFLQFWHEMVLHIIKCNTFRWVLLENTLHGL